MRRLGKVEIAVWCVGMGGSRDGNWVCHFSGYDSGYQSCIRCGASGDKCCRLLGLTGGDGVRGLVVKERAGWG